MNKKLIIFVLMGAVLSIAGCTEEIVYVDSPDVVVVKRPVKHVVVVKNQQPVVRASSGRVVQYAKPHQHRQVKTIVTSGHVTRIKQPHVKKVVVVENRKPLTVINTRIKKRKRHHPRLIRRLKRTVTLSEKNHVTQEVVRKKQIVRVS